ncbi:PQQ-dependent sugar dehydrogenase [Millisia brevis]|uniref:PQQ-dependent sugar dehydrogenase n=1 Tax=Millisia brevis TaxID=264148 RepID=UPI00083626A1|nr:PQQ-dependent sugar dehydrogenase [Millisia brevis]
MAPTGRTRSRARRQRRWSAPIAGGLLSAAVLAGCGVAEDSAESTTSPQRSSTTQPSTSGGPSDPTGAWTVEVVADGLANPWDVAQLPDGSFLVDERAGRLVVIDPDGAVTEVDADFDDLFARGETGLMGLVVDPAFDDNRRFYTCQGNADADDIRVISWRLSDDRRSAQRLDDPLVSGLVLSTGRHGGCRLAFDDTGSLLISAGDAAIGTTPQSLTDLGGKVLRVDPADGSPAAGNPFADSADAATRLIFTYGHRNVQGLALRPDSGQIVAAEHGPSIDDEINVLVPGGNYGWDPGAGGYDESVPMTDLDIPGAIPAVWSSGSPTVAVSGATFLDGPQWGRYDGWLAIATLRGSHLMLVELAPDGTVATVERPAELDGTRGRLREVLQGDDGALYVVTDNGDDDVLLRVTPG